MATVPKIDRVQASDIGFNKTPLNRIVEFKGLEKIDRANKALTDSLGASADAYTEVGKKIQLGYEKTNVSETNLEFRKFLNEATNGNPEKNIKGWRELKGLDGAAQAATIQKIIEDKRQELAGKVTSVWGKGSFLETSGGHQATNRSNQDIYNLTQGREARGAALKATVTASGQDLQVVNPGDTTQENDTVEALRVEAYRAGQFDGLTGEVLEQSINSAASIAIEQRIDNLQAGGHNAEAEAFFKRMEAQGYITPKMLGPLKAKVAVAADESQALTMTSGLFKARDLLPKTEQKTERKLLEEVRTTFAKQPKVAKLASQLVRQYFAAEVRAEKEISDKMMLNIIGKVDKGNLQFTPDERIEISKTLGLLAQLEKRAANVLSGRPPISDDTAVGQLYAMRREDPSKFSKLDLGQPPWVAALSSKDRDRFEGFANRITQAEITEGEQQKKATIAAARSAAALRGAKTLINSFKLTVEARGRLETQLSDEVERLTEMGVRFDSDSQYRDIVRGLMISGEKTGSGLLYDDDDLTVGAALEEKVPFDLDDFKNEKAVQNLVAETKLDADTVAELGSLIVTELQGVITPNTLLRQNAIVTSETLSGEKFRAANKELIRKLSSHPAVNATKASPTDVGRIVAQLAENRIPATPERVADQIEANITAIAQQRTAASAAAAAKTVADAAQKEEDAIAQALVDGATPPVPSEPVPVPSPKPPVTVEKLDDLDTAGRGKGGEYSENTYNNPGNIRANDKNAWEGKTGNRNGFVTFKTREDGVRAVGKLLQTYESKYKLNTVEAIISRFAPEKDNNDTEKYISNVAKDMGVKRTEKLSMKDRDTLTALVKAIIINEGSKDYTPEIVKTGLGRLF